MPGLCGDIREGAIVIVMKQMAGRAGSFLVLARQQLSVHQEDIGPPVVVVIENSHPASGSFKNVTLGFHSPFALSTRMPAFPVTSSNQAGPLCSTEGGYICFAAHSSNQHQEKHC